MPVACAAGAAPPGVYSLDPDHSQPVFEVSHLGISTYRGKFTRVSGRIVLDPAAGGGSAQISLYPGDLLTGSRQLDQILQGEDFFDVAQYPVAHFSASKIVFEGETPVRIEGDLTLRGVSKPMTVTIQSFKCAKHPLFVWREVCGAEASATIRRSEFGMTRYLASVGDEVRLLLSVEAFRD
jgi:polyisoprenoid-binding protein YceI